jgi:hypothetical protein
MFFSKLAKNYINGKPYLKFYIRKSQAGERRPTWNSVACIRGKELEVKLPADFGCWLPRQTVDKFLKEG